MTDIAKIRTGKVKGTMNSNNLSDYYYNHSFMERYGLFGLMALASCSDKMDYSETVVKDKDYVIQTFEKGGGSLATS